MDDGYIHHPLSNPNIFIDHHTLVIIYQPKSNNCKKLLEK